MLIFYIHVYIHIHVHYTAMVINELYHQNQSQYLKHKTQPSPRPPHVYEVEVKGQSDP